MGAPKLQPLLGPFLDAYAALHPGMAPGDRAHATLDLAKYPPRHIDQVLLQRDAFVPLQAAVILDEPDAEGTLASDHYGVLARFRVVADASDGPFSSRNPGRSARMRPRLRGRVRRPWCGTLPRPTAGTRLRRRSAGGPPRPVRCTASRVGRVRTTAVLAKRVSVR